MRLHSAEMTGTSLDKPDHDGVGFLSQRYLIAGIFSLLKRNSFRNCFPDKGERVSLSGGFHGVFARRRTRFLSAFPSVRLLAALLRAPICCCRNSKSDESAFGNTKMC